MSINKHNYEAYFLDYHEGNLSPVEAGEVLVFLEENPGLKETFETYDSLSILSENIPFPGKAELKKKYSAEGIEALISSGISPDNCEQFFIAHLEGQLSPERTAEMQSFFGKNPEKKKEFELFNQCRLPAEEVVFEAKASLKKQRITKENCEEYFIRAAEKDLDRAGEEELQKFLAANPGLRKEFELFSKTILAAETITFHDKASLRKKKRKPVVAVLYSRRTAYYAAAAAILLLAGLFFIFRNDGSKNTMLADKTHTSPNAVVNEKKLPGDTSVPVKNSTNIFPGDNSESKKAQEKDKASGNNSAAVNPAVPQQTPAKESPVREPVLMEEEAPFTAQQEPPLLPLLKEEDAAIAVNNKEENKTPQEAPALALAKTGADEYQTLWEFAGKKMRSALGVKKTNDCASDKFTWWDLAMAAKNGIQKITGTKAVDVTKSCDGNGEKVEYVFAAGNFEISKSTPK